MKEKIENNFNKVFSVLFFENKIKIPIPKIKKYIKIETRSHVALMYDAKRKNPMTESIDIIKISRALS